jgi:hypothetical protein
MLTVMPGLVPGIHVFAARFGAKDVDDRDSRHPRESGDPVFQSFRVLIADAAAYWMPAFAGMTATYNINSSRFREPKRRAYSRRLV